MNMTNRNTISLFMRKSNANRLSQLYSKRIKPITFKNLCKNILSYKIKP